MDNAVRSREEFFSSEFPKFYADIDGYDYALYQAHVVDRAYVNAVRQASADAWRIYRRALEIARHIPDEALIGMGIPGNSLHCVRIAYDGAPETVVGRFDFIVTPEGPKMIEFNAETPYFYWESHRISGAVVKSLGFDDPNEDEEARLGMALANAFDRLSRGGRAVVAGYEESFEDNATARYAFSVLKKYAKQEIEFASLQELKAFPDSLRDAKGEIDVLYRFYPMELFAVDEGGTEFFDLLAQDRVRVVNPPCSLLLQNKCLQVLIWGLHERGEYFTAEEHETIERVFIPSYYDLPEDGLEYVRKPVLGREGNSVSIVRRDEVLTESEYQDYALQPMIYQRRLRIPEVSYVSGGAQKAGHAITTCFLVGGEPGAIGMRVGAEITDAWSHFLPLAYEKDSW